MDVEADFKGGRKQARVLVYLVSSVSSLIGAIAQQSTSEYRSVAVHAGGCEMERQIELNAREGGASEMIEGQVYLKGRK